MALKPRERRLVRVYLPVVAAVVLGYTYGVEPLLERHEQVQTLLAAREELLAQRQRLITRRERYEKELAELRAELGERRAQLLPGDKAPLAASELQKLVKNTTQETGVEVRSERILPTSEHGGYTEVPVEVTLWGPVRGLAAFLHRLEEAPILLGVTDLRFRVVSVGAPRELTATLAVTGYISTGGNNAPQPSRGEPVRAPGS